MSISPSPALKLTAVSRFVKKSLMLDSSVSVAALRQDATGLSELGCGYVEKGGTWHQRQQRQVLLQLVQPGDRDDAVCVEQPVAEQDNQTLLLSNQVLKRLWW